jgi:hypothetical protein
VKLRIILSWLLAIPTLLLLLWSFVAFAAVLFLPAFNGHRAFLFAGSFLYLLIAHALYFGSYVAHPPLYQGALGFLSRIFHSRRALLVWGVLYAAAFSFVFYTIYFVNRREAPQSPDHALQRTAPHVTAAASGLRLSATMQPPRRAPRSLSLRSLGDFHAETQKSKPQ